jgi:hypothetical protein
MKAWLTLPLLLSLAARAAVPAGKTEEKTPSGAIVASRLDFNVDLGLAKEFGDYMRVTHNNTIYDGTFILVLNKPKPAATAAIRSGAARAIGEDVFLTAPVEVAIDFYVKAWKTHPDQETDIKREYAQMHRYLTKNKIKAIAFRPAKDESEGTLHLGRRHATK